MQSVGQAADSQADADIRLVAWATLGGFKPTRDDFAMLRLVLLALLPQIGGMRDGKRICHGPPGSSGAGPRRSGYMNATTFHDALPALRARRLVELFRPPCIENVLQLVESRYFGIGALGKLSTDVFGDLVHPAEPHLVESVEQTEKAVDRLLTHAHGCHALNKRFRSIDGQPPFLFEALEIGFQFMQAAYLTRWPRSIASDIYAREPPR